MWESYSPLPACDGFSVGRRLKQYRCKDTEGNQRSSQGCSKKGQQRQKGTGEGDDAAEKHRILQARPSLPHNGRKNTPKADGGQDSGNQWKEIAVPEGEKIKIGDRILNHLFRAVGKPHNHAKGQKLQNQRSRHKRQGEPSGRLGAEPWQANGKP